MPGAVLEPARPGRGWCPPSSHPGGPTLIRARLDGAGSAYIVGRTSSRNFPTSSGAFDRSYKGRSGERFVTKLNAAGSALAYSTFLGGSDDDGAHGIAVDGSGRAHVIGDTNSRSFPTTADAFDRRLGEFDDVFVTKLNAAGSALAYSTYLGGGFIDDGSGIALAREVRPMSSATRPPKTSPLPPAPSIGACLLGPLCGQADLVRPPAP